MIFEISFEIDHKFFLLQITLELLIFFTLLHRLPMFIFEALYYNFFFFKFIFSGHYAFMILLNFALTALSYACDIALYCF